MRGTTKLQTAALFAGVIAWAGPAGAESIINNPGDHPSYKIELEPQLAIGWDNLYVGNGFGAGLRLSIPIVDTGFVKTINDSVAIGFGFDWLHFGDCFFVDTRGKQRVSVGCGASYLVFPVVMQWNFWLSPHWSVFGEPGLYVYHGIYDDFCDPAFVDCRAPTRTGVDFAFYVGGRFHFNDTLALTMRLGYPTSSIGLSILF